MLKYTLAVSVVFLSGCSDTNPQTPVEAVQSSSYEAIGSITTTRPDIIDPSAQIEKLGGRFGWSEGPVWVDALDALLFTDVPGNSIWKFKDGEGITEYLTPSGAVPPIPEYTSSPGANGLILLDETHVLVPDHGNRALYRLNVHSKEKFSIADRFNEKRFNSPNDAVLESQYGHIFFTDPPYGLKGQDNSSAKELEHNGVYVLRRNGVIDLVADDLTRPNGIILSPDEKTLYVANSDSEAAFWMAYDMTESRYRVENPRKLLDVTEDIKTGLPGLPDGMAMAEDGTIFATGPGGVLILSPEGERLGLISTGTAIANVTFGGADGRDLYMTSHSFLARTRTKVKGYGF
jgi:gluconolactonase